MLNREMYLKYLHTYHRTEAYRNYQREWKKKNYLRLRSKILETERERRLANLEHFRAINRRADLKRREEKRKYNKSHWPEVYAKNKEVYLRKCDKRRRNLESNLLNKVFPGSERHHLNKKEIAFIPRDLHRSVKHNVFTGEGMKEINKMAIKFMEAQKE